jgi:glycosyltransferase involved in cell wall biosynthesis
MNGSPEPLRILLWSPKGAGLHYGGAGTNALRLYSSRSGRDVAVTLVCASRLQEDYPAFREIVRLGNDLDLGIRRQAAFLLRSRLWLARNASRFDVFHGIDSFEITTRPAFWAEQAGLPAFVKPAIQGAGLRPGGRLSTFLRLHERRRDLLDRVSGVIAISSVIESELRSAGIRNVIPIPNGVDAAQFRPAIPGERSDVRRELGLPDDAFVLLFVGSLVPRKRPHWLLEALADPSLAADSRLHVLLVGPPQDEAYLRELHTASAGPASGRVHFAGSRRDVERCYRAADAYCLPSTQEGMPNSVLEAMASGLPCLVTPISGSEDLVQDEGNGFLIRSPHDLGERLATYLADPGLAARHGQAGRRRVESTYSTEIVLGRHLDLFREAARARRSRTFAHVPCSSLP